MRQARQRARFAGEQPPGALPALQERVEHLDRDRMGGCVRARPGRVVVEPAPVDDAHAAFADARADHDLAPTEIDLGVLADARRGRRDCATPH